MTNTSSIPKDRVTIIGAGRLGRALAAALAGSGIDVRGPLRRGEWEDRISADEVVLLCVPDGEVATLARAISEDAIVGHCAGALTLERQSIDMDRKWPDGWAGPAMPHGAVFSR